jgi:hypothetical protein
MRFTAFVEIQLKPDTRGIGGSEGSKGLEDSGDTGSIGVAGDVSRDMR